MKIVVTKQFQQFLKEIGLSMDELLEQAQIPNYLWKEELKLTSDQYYKLLQAFDQKITDEQLLKFSQTENIQAFFPPFFAALCSKDGLNAIERLAKYKELIGPIKIEKKILNERIQITFRFVNDKYQLPRFAILNEQILLLSLVRQGSGQKIVPTAIKGPFEYSEILTEYIGTNALLSDNNVLEFKLTDLKIPFLTQNNSMLNYLEPEMKRRLDTQNEHSNQKTVQKLLMKAIPSGNYTINDIAFQMGLSVRSLQRNLKNENTSFNQEVKQTQTFLAENYLKKAELTTLEIAYLVGYSDSSSFSRAFKKWTGKTTSEYRKEYVKS